MSIVVPDMSVVEVEELDPPLELVPSEVEVDVDVDVVSIEVEPVSVPETSVVVSSVVPIVEVEPVAVIIPVEEVGSAVVPELSLVMLPEPSEVVGGCVELSVASTVVAVMVPTDVDAVVMVVIVPAPVCEVIVPSSPQPTARPTEVIHTSAFVRPMSFTHRKKEIESPRLSSVDLLLSSVDQGRKTAPMRTPQFLSARSRAES